VFEMARVAVGGTFEIIHKGHRALLATAFAAAMGDEVLIGLTADHLANRSRKRMVLPYGDREWALRSYIDRAFPGLDHVIEMINDEFGPAVDIPDLEVLVVSENTYPTGVRLNEAREARGLAPLRLLQIQHVMADDGKPISSTRILAGEVDADGRVVSS
jgi:pantetheine-phosphate adenylyltransferase